MKNKCGMLNGECGSNAAASVCAHASVPIPRSPVPIRSIRGLTLIELLVTIVIMVTVLAGVLPMISPNNNARKIRESARQLSSLMAQAQAQAARDGRPYGVAFREFDAGGTSYSGIALEAFTIAEPQPFAGFSEWSRVWLAPAGQTYGTGFPSPGTDPQPAFPKYVGRDQYVLNFALAGVNAALPPLDEIPPRTIRIGDIVSVNGIRFLIVDDADHKSAPNETMDQNDRTNTQLVATAELTCVIIDQGVPPIPMQSGGNPILRPYRILRQPANTSDAPLQFPRGIGIDLAASGADEIGTPKKLENFDQGGQADVTGIMFSPNGSLDAVYFNGTRYDGVAQVYMLMGLFENGNGTYDSADFDFSANPATGDNADMAGRRSRINWLSADSRWVTANRAGRIITSENNTSFDPSSADSLDSLPSDSGDAMREQRRRQIENARAYAKKMTGSSGR